MQEYFYMNTTVLKALSLDQRVQKCVWKWQKETRKILKGFVNG